MIAQSCTIIGLKPHPVTPRSRPARTTALKADAATVFWPHHGAPDCTTAGCVEGACCRPTDTVRSSLPASRCTSATSNPRRVRGGCAPARPAPADPQTPSSAACRRRRQCCSAPRTPWNRTWDKEPCGGARGARQARNVDADAAEDDGRWEWTQRWSPPASAISHRRTPRQTTNPSFESACCVWHGGSQMTRGLSLQ